MSVNALILAAGSARRFGSDKRMALLPDGTPVLHATLARYAGLFDIVGVVLRPGDSFGLAACQSYDCVPIVAPDAHLGMGASLAAGIRTLEAASTGGLIVGLADMPGISREVITQIRDHLASRQRLVVPIYQDAPGHPRGIPAARLTALNQLTGDEGARGILPWGEADRIECDCPGIHWDIDVAEDLERDSAVRGAL